MGAVKRAPKGKIAYKSIDSYVPPKKSARKSGEGHNFPPNNVWGVDLVSAPATPNAKMKVDYPHVWPMLPFEMEYDAKNDMIIVDVSDMTVEETKELLSLTKRKVENQETFEGIINELNDIYNLELVLVPPITASDYKVPRYVPIYKEYNWIQRIIIYIKTRFQDLSTYLWLQRAS